MNTRTFFKIYSFPFLIVLIGLAIYASIIIFMDQGNLILSRPNHSHELTTLEHIAHLDKSDDKKNTNPNNVSLPATTIDNNHNTENVEDKGIASQPTPIENPISPPKQSHQDSIYYAQYRINIRNMPSSEGMVISRASVGEALEVLDWQEQWSKVRKQSGVEGYVASRLLTKQENLEGKVYIVSSTTLNVRLKPDTQAAIIGRLKYHTRIAVLETQGEWAKIQLPNKQYGYISTNFIAKE
ncbi:SH3 domain-containing protein [Helicobacter mastomyrinus]|uniref:SH3 domain-containing protein n=1 Tax=Helicobacter mastomyrinus TaxID=287948 RepID=A0ABZ3F6W5_9HELI|nr:SH3 domain-containing protein [uncultured Helicobacter sp.]